MPSGLATARWHWSAWSLLVLVTLTASLAQAAAQAVAVGDRAADRDPCPLPSDRVSYRHGGSLAGLSSRCCGWAAAERRHRMKQLCLFGRAGGEGWVQGMGVHRLGRSPWRIQWPTNFQK